MSKGECHQHSQRKIMSLCHNPAELWFGEVCSSLSRVLEGRSLPWTLRPVNTGSKIRSQAEQRFPNSLERTQRPRPGASPRYFLFPPSSGDFLSRGRSCLPPRRWCGSALGCQGNCGAGWSSAGKWGCQTGWGKGVLCLGPMSQGLRRTQLAKGKVTCAWTGFGYTLTVFQTILTSFN